MLVKFVQNKKEYWEDHIDSCVFAYNTAKHDSTQFSPFELMFARQPTLPVDIQVDASDLTSEMEYIYEGCYFFKYMLNVLASVMHLQMQGLEKRD
jgi:hypothetical protein